MSFPANSTLVALVLAGALQAQGVPQEPVGTAPNPYLTIEGWAKLPDGRVWGSLSAVDVDKDGVSIWVAERCGANSCRNSTLAPIMKFDSTGRVVKSF